MKRTPEGSVFFILTNWILDSRPLEHVYVYIYIICIIHIYIHTHWSDELHSPISEYSNNAVKGGCNSYVCV